MASSSTGELQTPVRGARGEVPYLSELQRGRLLSATFALVGELGYAGVSARGVSERAGMSTRTFYEFFSDREDCFLAAFDHAIAGLEDEVRGGWVSEGEWVAKVRAGLAALLETLDREPAVRRLVFVEALAAGPRVLARRGRVLESLASVIDEGRVGGNAPVGLPVVTAEGVLGATFGVIHIRLLALSPRPLVELLGQLMATIVLPYRGSAVAARELKQSASAGRRGASRSRTRGHRDAPSIALGSLGSASPVDYRLTIRTQMALAAVASRPGVNNRGVSEIIGLADQGQVSRIMSRLSEQGLVKDTQDHTGRKEKAWRLTPDGEDVLDVHRDGRDLIKAQRKNSKSGKGGKLVPRRGRPVKQGIAGGGIEVVSTRFRMTVLTHQVLRAVGELSEWGPNPTNRGIAQAAGVKDEGQISKLLTRLQGHGLLANTGGLDKGANAWRLTQRGEELLHASQLEEQGR